MSGNSHQRRRATRHWRHLYHLENIRASSLNALVIRQWCEESFGKKDYGYRWACQIYRNDEYGSAFCVAFHNDRDANWFTMKWVT